MPLLEIENLTVEFATAGGAFRAVDGLSVNLELERCAGDRGGIRVRQVGCHAGHDGAFAMDCNSIC